MDSGGGLSGPRCAAHVVVAEKKDGRTLFEQLSTTRYKCKFVSSDSTHKEVKETAEAWSNGKLDILISTTMGLVGNENPYCRYLVCVGYLYDSMQIVQAFGRLRNYMRTSFGQVLFAVPDKLSDHRTKDDEHRYTRLLNENFISSKDHCNFKAVMTSSGVHDWLSDTSQGQRVVRSRFCRLRLGESVRQLWSLPLLSQHSVDESPKRGNQPHSSSPKG
ncbi:hypothetical protein MHU86_1401 [Fragilaria crotonensis]|nr:hypothetical protein MHU86_1401 [Fragilaria crotonensis]